MSKRPRRTWTPEQKRQLVADARRRMAAGESVRQAAQSLDLHEATLRQWLNRQPVGLLQPVQVVEDQVAAVAGTMSLVTPDGFVFDGLDLGSAVRLWERLR